MSFKREGTHSICCIGIVARGPAGQLLGLLRREQTAQGLDASGLAGLLAGQKNNIAAALPSGFGEMLGASGVPGFSGQTPQATRAQFEDASRSWWRWVLAAVAAAALAWWFFGPTQVAKETETTPVKTKPVKQTEMAPAPAVRNLSVDGVDLKSSLESALAGLKANLQGVSDAASARAALPQLEKEAAEFDKIRELSAKLPADSKSALAALVAAARPALEGLFDKVLAIPGVSDIAKPVIEGLRAKLDALSKA